VSSVTVALTVYHGTNDPLTVPGDHQPAPGWRKPRCFVCYELLKAGDTYFYVNTDRGWINVCDDCMEELPYPEVGEI